MKKVLSIILAMLVVLSSFCGLNAYAVEEVKPKTDAILDRLESEEELLVTLKAGSTNLFGFLPAEITNTVAVNADSIVYQYSVGFISVRVIASKDGIYAYLPEIPYFYVKLEGLPAIGDEIWSWVKDGADITQLFIEYQGNYTEEVNGKEYYVEEYNDREFVTSKFYYEGDTLVFLNVTDSSTGSVQNTYFDVISFDVEDSFFAVPEDAFDVTPLLKGLFTTILGAIGSM